MAKQRVPAERSAPVPVEQIGRSILILRGHRVLLDSELAALYGVTTKRLNEQVKRNAERFPDDFIFRLTRTETEALNRSQIATGSQKHRDPRFPPFAFTEHGAIMAATVLNSPRAVSPMAPPLSRRFHVPARRRGGGAFKVANCDLEQWTRPKHRQYFDSTGGRSFDHGGPIGDEN
jgi:ORF6N domain